MPTQHGKKEAVVRSDDSSILIPATKKDGNSRLFFVEKFHFLSP